jgi:hypothetical protein
VTFDDDWADDFQRRLNERMFGGFTYSEDQVIYDEWERWNRAQQQRGPYKTAFGTSTWGPPHLIRVYRCKCGHNEADHDDTGLCHRPGGFAGICDCGPRTPDPLVEMIESWL